MIAPNADPAATAARIEELRARLGAKVVLLGHHYQDESVIRHVDIRGDSLELARKAADVASEHIVFCGVYFMAESAALLARKGQKVHLPEMSATCVMAQMAPADLVEKIIKKCNERRNVVPLVYVNSSVAVKAVAGKYGGTVCTSANAGRMLAWAMKQGDAVLFLPDKNLGRNTADLLGINKADCHMLAIRQGGAALDQDEADSARFILWPGCCAIHARFNVRQIQSRREEYPGIRIVVHPECSPEVVAASDAVGSTSFIIRYVDQAPEGACIAVGTEVNLVDRLAAQHKGKKIVVPLLESECSHMDRTKPAQLLRALESIADPGNLPHFPCMVTVDPAIAHDAKAALDRMLAIMG